jgi:drug/metabolite transporter (DMT)-like permease
MGLVAVSFASVLIKLCTAPALVIATYRLVISSFLCIVVARTRRGPDWHRALAGQRKLLFVSGLFLSLHFIAWISSLKYTTVASSVVLVQTAPVFVALGSSLFLGEKPSPSVIAGILLAVLGSLVIGAHDLFTARSSLVGNLYALLGAVGAAGYMIAGRRLRAEIDTLSYAASVYSAAAIILLAVSLITASPLHGYSTRDLLLLILIALVPQFIGHTTFNWALGHLSATTVSLVLLGEPIGASLLAMLILHETPGAFTVIGALLVLLGVAAVLLQEGRTRSKATLSPRDETSS